MDAFYVFKIVIGAKWRKASNLSFAFETKGDSNWLTSERWLILDKCYNPFYVLN